MHLSILTLLLNASVVLSFASEAAPVSSFNSALMEYVKKPDSSYSWKIEKTLHGKDATTFIIHLRSQTWRSASEVQKPLWEHALIVIRPKKLKFHKALLNVSNGNSRDPLPSEAGDLWLKAAVETQSVVAQIRNVPNQPIVYFNDGEERFEDNSVAYSWEKAMATHDPTWNVRLPAVKSVVRAMDTIQSLLSSQEGKHFDIDEFIVMGESKRGLTTWLSATVDSRVAAIIPLVTDDLNLEKFLRHHYSAYGFWAPPLKDYVRHKFLSRLFTPEFYDLLALDDPYSYLDKLTVPKFVINAMNDQFFLPDGAQFYFNDLPGRKFLRAIPNCDHYLRNSDALSTAIGFYSAFISDSALPEITWQKQKDGSLLVKSSLPPEKALLWSAHQPTARDFRANTVGMDAFSSQVIKPGADGSFIGRMDKPSQGFVAFFVELQYPSQGPYPLKFTSEVSILPDVLPFSEQFEKEIVGKKD